MQTSSIYFILALADVNAPRSSRILSLIIQFGPFFQQLKTPVFLVSAKPQKGLVPSGLPDFIYPVPLLEGQSKDALYALREKQVFGSKRCYVPNFLALYDEKEQIDSISRFQASAVKTLLQKAARLRYRQFVAELNLTAARSTDGRLPVSVLK